MGGESGGGLLEFVDENETEIESVNKTQSETKSKIQN